MEPEQVYIHLKAIWEKLGVEVREQALSYELGKAKGGLVRLGEKKIFFIERSLSLQEKIELMLNELQKQKLDEIYIPPYLRKMIEK